MTFTTKSEYGLRAVLNLARKYPGHLVSLPDIAKEEGISPAYLERLIALLKKNKIVIASKGVKGGYQLAAFPDQISVAEVFKALEGSLKSFNCESISNVGCECGKGCAVKRVWLKLDEAILKTLEGTKLSDLI